MGYIVIAPVGDNLKALFVGIKEFPTEKVILLTPSSGRPEAEKLRRQLDEFTIPSEIVELKGDMMGEMFRAFGKLCANYENDRLIVNVATGDRMSTCAALSASYANGIKAFGVMDGKPMLLPIMRLSYYHELSESKLAILKTMKPGVWTPIHTLAKSLKMSVSLLSYHINGNYTSKGFKQYHLVETKEEGKNVLVKISDIGSLLLKGYVPECC